MNVIALHIIIFEYQSYGNVASANVVHATAPIATPHHTIPNNHRRTETRKAWQTDNLTTWHLMKTKTKE